MWLQLSNSTKNKIWFALVLLVLGLIFLPVPVGAEPNTSSYIGAPIFAICIGIGGIVAWLGGITLDLMIEFAVIGFGSALTSNIGVVVNELWVVIRDVFNMLFIFSLIYLGLRIILKSDDTGTRKQIGLLIIAALLINFSLFITKTIVDFSNLAAYQVYAQIVDNNIVTTGATDQKFDVDQALTSLNQPGRSISGNFMQHLGLPTFATISSLDQVGTSDSFFGNIGRIVVFSVGMMIFMIVAGIVFFAGAFLLLTRFVALVLYMIFSPVMFLGMILPAFNQYASKWWSGFLSNAFVAPAYLFMLLLGLLVISRADFAGGRNGSFGELFSSGSAGFTSDAAAIILFYFLGIAFLYASVLVAKQMGAAGATTALKMVDGARNGMQSAIGRNSIGRLSAGGLQASEWLEGRRWGRNLKRVATAATLGTVDEQARRKAFQKGREATFGGSRSHASNAQWSEQNFSLRARRESVRDLRSNISRGRNADITTAEGREQRANMERSIANASTAQLEELGANALGSAAVAGALSQSQFESIMKSEKFTDAEKAKIGEARGEQTKVKLREDPNNPDSRVVVENASISQLQSLGSKYLSKEQYAVRLSNKQIDELEKKLTEAEIKAIKDARKAALEKIAGGGKVNSGGEELDIKFILNKKPGEIAKLPKSVILQSVLAKELPVAVLNEIAKEQTLAVNDQITIRNLLVNNVIPINDQRAQDVDAWLNESPLGKNFGKL